MYSFFQHSRQSTVKLKPEGSILKDGAFPLMLENHNKVGNPLADFEQRMTKK